MHFEALKADFQKGSVLHRLRVSAANLHSLLSGKKVSAVLSIPFAIYHPSITSFHSSITLFLPLDDLAYLNFKQCLLTVIAAHACTYTILCMCDRVEMTACAVVLFCGCNTGIMLAYRYVHAHTHIHTRARTHAHTSTKTYIKLSPPSDSYSHFRS